MNTILWQCVRLVLELAFTILDAPNGPVIMIFGGVCWACCRAIQKLVEKTSREKLSLARVAI